MQMMSSAHRLIHSGGSLDCDYEDYNLHCRLRSLGPARVGRQLQVGHSELVDAQSVLVVYENIAGLHVEIDDLQDWSKDDSRSSDRRPARQPD